MPARIVILIALALQMSACIATPRLKMAEHYSFDYVYVVPEPMSYNDLLCCYDCTV